MQPGRRREHGVRTDAPQRVAHHELGVAALAAGEARDEQILELPHLVVDARRRDVAQRAGGAGLHARRIAAAEVALDDARRRARCGRCRRTRSRRCTAGSRCTSCRPSRSTPLPSFFASAAAGQFATHFGSPHCRHSASSKRAVAGNDLDARVDDVVRSGLRLRAGGHARVAAVAARGVEGDRGIGAPPSLISTSATSARGPLPAARARKRSRTGARSIAAQDQLPHHAGIERRRRCRRCRAGGCPRARS